MKYYKYCASGNDFIIYAKESLVACPKNALDAKAGKDGLYLNIFGAGRSSDFAYKQHEELSKSEIKRLCNRHEGIGADGLIVLKPIKGYDFEWEFYNADASEAKMCGNGARAAVHFAHHHLHLPSKLTFLSGAGLIKAEVFKDEVELNMGVPKLCKENIELAGCKIKASLLDTGVPHLVFYSDKLEDFDKLDLKALRQEFDANVNLACFKEGKLFVRTYERGVEAETLACGTGMMASFYEGYKKGLFGEEILLVPKSLEVLKAKIDKNELFFKGRVNFVFTANTPS